MVIGCRRRRRGNSLMYIEYKNEERIDPCRTPVTGEKRVDVALLSSTSIWTSSNKFRSRLMSAAGAIFF